MDYYLSMLEQFRLNYSFMKIDHVIDGLEEYVKGNIDSNELMEGITEVKHQAFVKDIINKMLNFKEKDIYYHIDLPQDIYYNSNSVITASTIVEMDLVYDIMNAVGPTELITRFPEHTTENLIEITGDFSNYPNGVELNRSDWMKIISKHPGLINMMLNLNKENSLGTLNVDEIDIRNQIDEIINQEILSGQPDYLPEEFINSLKLSFPYEYVSGLQVTNGEFPSFEELHSLKNSLFQNNLNNNFTL